MGHGVVDPHERRPWEDLFLIDLHGDKLLEGLADACVVENGTPPSMEASAVGLLLPRVVGSASPC